MVKLLTKQIKISPIYHGWLERRLKKNNKKRSDDEPRETLFVLANKIIKLGIEEYLKQ